MRRTYLEFYSKELVIYFCVIVAFAEILGNLFQARFETYTYRIETIRKF